MGLSTKIWKKSKKPIKVRITAVKWRMRFVIETKVVGSHKDATVWAPLSSTSWIVHCKMGFAVPSCPFWGAVKRDHSSFSSVLLVAAFFFSWMNSAKSVKIFDWEFALLVRTCFNCTDRWCRTPKSRYSDGLRRVSNTVVTYSPRATQKPGHLQSCCKARFRLPRAWCCVGNFGCHKEFVFKNLNQTEKVCATKDCGWYYRSVLPRGDFFVRPVFVTFRIADSRYPLHCRFLYHLKLTWKSLLWNDINTRMLVFTFHVNFSMSVHRLTLGRTNVTEKQTRNNV